MAGLLYLTTQDFHQKKTQDNRIVLCTSIKDLSLILFYSNSCQYCPAFVEVFKQLPGTIPCQFGIINVSANKQVPLMSKGTTSVINVVPFVLLYIDGIPFQLYSGRPVAQEIINFIVQVSNNINNKQAFLKKKQGANTISTAKKIPEYCIGQPICGGKDQMVCYLNFEEYETKLKAGGAKKS